MEHEAADGWVHVSDGWVHVCTKHKHTVGDNNIQAAVVFRQHIITKIREGDVSSRM